MITDEEVEAACVAYAGGTTEHLSARDLSRLRQDIRRALEAAEAVRPGMVEVGEVVFGDDEHPQSVGWSETVCLKVGAKLYAEQPKPSDPNNPVDSFGATVA